MLSDGQGGKQVVGIRNMESSPNRYNQRGVSSSKEEVHKVVDQMDHGLFPGAFCKITEDVITGAGSLLQYHSLRWSWHQINTWISLV